MILRIIKYGALGTAGVFLVTGLFFGQDAVSYLAAPRTAFGAAGPSSTLPATREEPVGAADDRETVLDRKVHLEKDLVRKIPQVPRLCDATKSFRQRVSDDGCELYCEVEGEGIPLVLLHGGPGATHHYFHPAFLRAAGFAKVIYYDQRGCGLSDYKKGKGYSVNQAVDDLENLRKALSIRKWIVLGHSYGGLLAQCYAAKHSDSLAGLVLVGSAIPAPIPLAPSRDDTYLSPEEQARIGKVHSTFGLSIEQKIYNAFLNGDWKRQCYYKPSPEKIARIALYEWKQNSDFNRVMSGNVQTIDLSGAFKACPIPTLIVEGKWDLTWNTDKPEKLHEIHPRARLVVLERSGHGPFDDEPNRFFAVLREFAGNLPAVPPADLGQWKKQLAERQRSREASFGGIVRSAGWGRRSSERIANAYTGETLKELDNPSLTRRTGFALYDAHRYEDALAVFRRMQEQAGADKMISSTSLIWEGHMLDLLGRRDAAVAVYKKAASIGETSGMSHDQYGLAYVPSTYALERIKTPFLRMENRLPD